MVSGLANWWPYSQSSSRVAEPCFNMERFLGLSVSKETRGRSLSRKAVSISCSSPSLSGTTVGRGGSQWKSPLSIGSRPNPGIQAGVAQSAPGCKLGAVEPHHAGHCPHGIRWSHLRLVGWVACPKLEQQGLDAENPAHLGIPASHSHAYSRHCQQQREPCCLHLQIAVQGRPELWSSAPFAQRDKDGFSGLCIHPIGPMKQPPCFHG